MVIIKNKPYCIEERAKKLFGLTNIFEFAGYMLEDGTMLNFSYGGYQRDEDHRIIGQFYKKAQGTQALGKFMRRGNIRMMCHPNYYYLEFAKPPTTEQISRIKEIEKDAHKLGYEFLLEKNDRKGRIAKSYTSIYQYLGEYEYGQA